MKAQVCGLATYIEKKINKTITLQETRTKPNLLQRILADEVMIKRWKLKTEENYFRRYEADIDVHENELRKDFEFYYFESKIFPS